MTRIHNDLIRTDGMVNLSTILEYLNDGHSTNEAAEKFDVKPFTIQQALWRAGYQTAPTRWEKEPREEARDA